MRIDVLTLFPEMFHGVFGASILGKAKDKGIVSLNAVNFREYANNKHNTVDDYPYGGGGGMVLKPEPLFAAVEDLMPEGAERPHVILLCPQGEPYTQKKAEELSAHKHLVFVCGHYEGYDERIRQHLVTDEISLGDYVLTGGELPAMVMIDSIVRLLPGVLGNENSAVTDSFSTGLLEHPHYTRPAVFRDWEVPEVLMSGHHANVEVWRRQQSILRTLERRPEMLETAELTKKERQWLNEQIRSREQSRNN
ncbi:tRNA (guanosine(37)-N1)-methyltransferase TrmD [Paenibacillus sp. CF384]|uniref:tRNA (guanosine(37)-N1)-methyltransferase TrmD n=1 Tax=Paenibacillus sp. CF384 TaxID=1884382 RepID=UPI00089592D1|nr:tRNA (guanosine(37)-N1)-methyltransferase TrmD [Paenibacillus sp. CF384]SDW28266.1 tRNA (guanine37-N1)-methyltransferase [Paenibacillus sp. CF384]